MRIIIDGHGRIDRQAMAVERLKTIDMTPAGGGDAQDWVGAVLLQCLFDRFGSVFPQCGLMVFPGVVIVSR